MFAAMASSDSPRLRPRTPGPTSPSVGTNPLILNAFGSWEKISNRCRSKSPKPRGSSRFHWRDGSKLNRRLLRLRHAFIELPDLLAAKSGARPASAQPRRGAGRALPRRRAPWLPFCTCCLSKFMRSRCASRGGREHESLREKRSGLPSDRTRRGRRRARIEFDPRSEGKRKIN